MPAPGLSLSAFSRDSGVKTEGRVALPQWCVCSKLITSSDSWKTASQLSNVDGAIANDADLEFYFFYMLRCEAISSIP
jgi:hypothetical protein